MQALPATVPVTPSPVPAAFSRPHPAVLDAARSYTVRRGDTLTSIAAKLWGHPARWPLLWKANHIHNPNYIRAGQRLKVPADPAVSQHVVNEAYAAIPPPPPPPAPVTITVHAATQPAGFSDPVGTFTQNTQQATAQAEAPAPAAPAAAPVSAAPGGIWGCIAQHESGGNPAENTGNGFYGMYQFTPASWQAAGGGPGLPSSYSAAEQLRVAQNLQAMSGWGNWPVTSVACGAG